MSIGSRIKERREAMHITQEELAHLLGVSKGAVGNYESGTSYPKIENMNKLFNVLKTDANFLFQDEIDKLKDDRLSEQERMTIKKYRILDKHGKKVVDFILNEEYDRCTYIEKPEEKSDDFISLSYSMLKASAGVGEWLDEEQFDKINVKDTPEARKADMVIEVDGHSMEPDYYDGDKVLVRLQPNIYVGEIGIFILNGRGYIKKLGVDELISVNPEYDNVPLDEYNECRCVGKVVGVAEV